mmetsp:Transcript_21850/g.19389  ORF Transcript_21850/g.19389 Transcript_21850/m.19389 type:complete len:239 (+) Transcript_21850:389-1105(+)
MHIMQYNQVIFSIEEDNALRSKIGLRDIRKEMGFTKQDTWPFLLVDSSSPVIDTADIQGKDSIVEFFIDQGLLYDVKTHSAYEKQGIDWISTRALSAFELLKATFRGKFQYYFVSKNFAHSTSGIEGAKIVRSFMWKMYKPLHYHITEIKERRGRKDEIKNRFQNFHDIIDEWEMRIGENKYHGGSGPDGADFKMYSLAFAHHHMYSIKNLLRSRGGMDQKYNIWYARMNQELHNKFK